MLRRTRSSAEAVLLLAAVAVISCRKPDYFPLKDSQEWWYAATEYEISPPDTTTTDGRIYAIAVTGSAAEPGLGKVYEVRITRDEEPHLSFYFRKTRSAVFVLPASHLDGLEPTPDWVKLLELPLREGGFWYGDAERSVSFEVMARETVETPMGRFRGCFRIRIHAPQPYLIDVWIAPDAGIIRWNRRFSSTRFEVVERIRR
jgi:hypothetical protein